MSERREPLDLDRIIEVVFVLFAFTMYAAGSVLGAFLLGGWLGAFALAGFGIPPMVYVLAKSAQRKAEQALRDDFRAQQERTVAGVEIPILP